MQIIVPRHAPRKTRRFPRDYRILTPRKRRKKTKVIIAVLVFSLSFHQDLPTTNKKNSKTC
jgi:hypothetical protein